MIIFITPLREIQIFALNNIVNWAREFDKILVIHCHGHPEDPEGRVTLDLEILKEEIGENYPIHVRLFNGSAEKIQLWKDNFLKAKFGISTVLLACSK